MRNTVCTNWREELDNRGRPIIMTRPGRRKQHKVTLISSARLANSLRVPVTLKKKVSGRRQVAVDVGYSLYSTDSEDQVTTIHKGLDHCAALLNGMLQMEKTDLRQSCTRRGRLVPSKPTAKFGKGDAKKKPVRKTGSVNQTPKVPDPQKSTVFNGCLTTSTPTMMPEKSNKSVCSEPLQHSVEAGVMGPSDPALKKQVPYSKVKNMSRHEAAKKVTTVKNLLGELKTIVADQIDCVALISEVEQSISMLPDMVGYTNIQAEVAQELQPLRSENAQLRRRLRIVNQQLMERERAEKEAQSVDYNFEMMSVQMVNQSLQRQLKEMKRDINALLKENQELQQRNNQLLQVMEDRDGELHQICQQSKLDTNCIRLDVDDTISEIKSCQPTLDASDKENPSLSLGLQRREAVVNRLQQATRKMSRIASELPLEKNGPEPSLNHTTFLDLCEHQQKEACPANPISDSINMFLNSLEENSRSSPGTIYCSVGNVPHSDWNRREVSRLTEDIVYLPKHQTVLSEAEKDFGFSLDGEPQQGKTIYVPLKETQPSGDVRRLSPFESLNHVMSLECSNKIQDEHRETKGVAQSFERLHISEGPLVHVPVFDDLIGNLQSKAVCGFQLECKLLVFI
ncbi:hypothetical protein SKAU_G00236840 [Synaphobranchus kaupii]|uniref:Coiled-coil domain-containing protein 14 n=1 Tax=Synaphobranchus kaupii TaxID=118154 RepID=A0A9Q1IRT0_SYNKA|nr:hypothetical protein SKAU_G00236840 [Synaphobranchus kaupii]